MSTDNVHRPEDEVLDPLLDCDAEGGMAERLVAFRKLSEEMRRQTVGTSQTPSEILIREDRESGHRDA